VPLNKVSRSEAFVLRWTNMEYEVYDRNHRNIVAMFVKKIKIKLSLSTPCGNTRRMEVQLHSLLPTELAGDERSTSGSRRFTPSPEARHPMHRMLAVFQRWSGLCAENTVFPTLIRTLNRSACSLASKPNMLSKLQ
jgi:hypothetical protein